MDTLARRERPAPRQERPAPPADAGGGESTLRWHRAMWMGAGTGLLLTILVLLYIVWATVTDVTAIVNGQITYANAAAASEGARAAAQSAASPAFIVSGISIVTLTLVRLLAILIGAAIAFAGIAVSFYAHAKGSHFSAGRGEGRSTLGRITLATHSPGIVGIVIGAAVIISAVVAKGRFDYAEPLAPPPAARADNTGESPGVGAQEPSPAKPSIPSLSRNSTSPPPRGGSRSEGMVMP